MRYLANLVCGKDALCNNWGGLICVVCRDGVFVWRFWQQIHQHNGIVRHSRHIKRSSSILANIFNSVALRTWDACPLQFCFVVVQYFGWKLPWFGSAHEYSSFPPSNCTFQTWELDEASLVGWSGRWHGLLAWTERAIHDEIRPTPRHAAITWNISAYLAWQTPKTRRIEE